MLLPSDAGNPAAMIAQSLQIFKHTHESNLMAAARGQRQRAAVVEEGNLASGLPSLGDILPKQK